MKQFEEIVDPEHELVLERVAAIDVGKNNGMVCLRLPHPSRPGVRISRVWQVEATHNAVAQLAYELVGQQVAKVSIESTSDYWRIWFYLLEAGGVSVQLVNARDAKNAPGRPKTDKLDAVWLAKLTEKGMLRPSFVPEPALRALRDYTRLRVELTRERTRYWQRLEKLLEDALIKISSVASRLDTISTRDMIEALIAGQRDPKVLAGLARGKMRAKHKQLVEACTGRFDEHHGELARMLLEQIDTLNTKIDRLTSRISQQLSELATTPPTQAADQPAVDPISRLSSIPGINQHLAQTILAEIGLDMTRFPTPGHLASWAKLTPRTLQSGATSTTRGTGKGNGYLKGALGTAAAAAARTHTFLGARYRRIVKRRGKLRALVAVARNILEIIWQLLSNPNTTYRDLGADYHTTRMGKEKMARRHIQQLHALGYRVILEPAT